jgi:hypothetical protein
MKACNIDTQEAPNKWWAAQDARMRNIVNMSRYSDAEKVRAERMKLALELAYFAKSVYIAFGKKGISVKVDGAEVRDRKNLKLLEAEWTTAGIVKKISPQGVIYRLNG